MARLGPLGIRRALGVIFFAHGAQKMLGWWGGAGFSGTVEAFTKQGMPAPLAMLVIAAEFFGGMGVFFGCLTLGYLAMAVSLMLTGAGPLSIDALRGGKWTDLDAG